MNRHIHADKIIAKAENMDLVVISQNQKDDSWLVQNDQGTTDFGDCINYFLCLPQHKEACLHWLNGGDIEAQMREAGVKLEHMTVNPNKEWSNKTVFMSGECDIRIKQKKEKRWVRVRSNGVSLDTMILFNTKGHARGDGDYQVFEIEVEV